jgi:hypothetical protein
MLLLLGSHWEMRLINHQLLAVTEDNTIGTTDNKLGDFTDKNTTPDDYDYDANGNLLSDKNKKITLIEYNHMNLPWSLTVQNDDATDKGNIVYIYDATGNKLEKRTSELPSTFNSNTTKQTTTSYLSCFVYENNKLQFFAQEEGRIRYKQIMDGNFAFDYFIKDHLGNVRMVLTDEQTTNYYPAATLEGTYGGSTNNMVNYEKQFYNIDSSKITAENSTLLLPSWGAPPETLANTKLYYNNNSSPSTNVTPVPPNLSYPCVQHGLLQVTNFWFAGSL